MNMSSNSSRHSGKQIPDDIAGHSCEPNVQALEFYGKPLVVNAELVEKCRVKVMDVNNVFDGVVAEFVRRAVSESALKAAAGEEH